MGVKKADPAEDICKTLQGTFKIGEEKAPGDQK